MNTLLTAAEHGFSLGAKLLLSPYGGDGGDGGEDTLFSPLSAPAETNSRELEKVLTARLSSDKTPVGLGFSGVCYPEEEKTLRLTERILELLYDLRVPVCIMTKSALILRDAGIISTVSRRSGASVAVPVICSDGMSEIFEHGQAPPSFRFEIINRLSSSGIRCGVRIAPVVPFFTDSAESIRRIISNARKSGASFASADFSLTLNDRQKRLFLLTLDAYFPGFSTLFGDMSGDSFISRKAAFLREVFYSECLKNDLEIIER